MLCSKVLDWWGRESSVTKTLEKGAISERRKNLCSHFQPPADWDRDKTLMLTVAPQRVAMREKKKSVLMRIWDELCTELFQSATCLVLGLVEQECKSQRIQDLQGENSQGFWRRSQGPRIQPTNDVAWRCVVLSDTGRSNCFSNGQSRFRFTASYRSQRPDSML